MNSGKVDFEKPGALCFRRKQRWGAKHSPVNLWIGECADFHAAFGWLVVCLLFVCLCGVYLLSMCLFSVCLVTYLSFICLFACCLFVCCLSAVFLLMLM